jgi:hypothetical protein
MHWPTTAAVIFAALAVARAAAADPRLDEKVYTPYVENGVGELETRYASQAGGPSGGQSATVIEGEYGLGDRLSLAVVGTIGRDPGDGTRLSGIGLESVIYLGQIPAVGVDAGAYLEYTHGLAGDPDALEGKLLLAKTAGRFQGLANLIIERPLSGPEAFGAYGYALSATWRATGAWRLGAEAFGNLGSEHGLEGGGGAYVGPQVKWEGHAGKLPFEIGLDAGWLFPVGSERAQAASQVRVGLEFGRRF